MTIENKNIIENQIGKLFYFIVGIEVLFSLVLIRSVMDIFKRDNVQIQFSLFICSIIAGLMWRWLRYECNYYAESNVFPAKWKLILSKLSYYLFIIFSLSGFVSLLFLLD